jgi:hypothetical protein
MNTPDVHARLRQAFEMPTHNVADVDPGVVLADGRRRRRNRRIRQVVAAAVAGVVLAAGVGVAHVPSTGTVLSPVASWLRGEHRSAPWMDANGQRFVVTVDSIRVPGELNFSMSVLNADGTTTELSQTPTTAQQLPAVGMSIGGFPGVVFGIFAAGSHNIAAHTPDERYHFEDSTMTVTDPATGQDYVAAAISATYDATSQIRSWTWTDAEGNPRSFGF